MIGTKALSRFPTKTGRVCGECAIASNIPIDMTKQPGWINCDECQQYKKTYRRTDNVEETTPSPSDLTLDK